MKLERVLKCFVEVEVNRSNVQMDSRVAGMIAESLYEIQQAEGGQEEKREEEEKEERKRRDERREEEKRTEKEEEGKEEKEKKVGIM